MWQATFGSPSLCQYAVYSYLIAAALPDIEGVVAAQKCALERHNPRMLCRLTPLSSISTPMPPITPQKQMSGARLA